MKKLNQKGIAPLLIVGIIVIIGVVGFTGWYVYDKNKNTTTTTQETQNTEDNTTEAKTVKDTDSWYLHKSTNEEYTIRLANGLTFVSGDAGDPFLSIYTRDLTTNESTVAKVVPQTGGSDNPYGLFIDYHPSGNQVYVEGDKQQGFKTDSGLDVEKYYYYQTINPEGLGLQKGDKEYTYKVVKDNKTVTVSYDISSTQDPNTELVEKMVRTVEIN